MSLNLHTAADYYLRSWGAWLNPNLIPDPDALSGDTGRFNNMRALTKIPTVIGKTSQVFQDYFVQWAGDYPQGFTDPTNSNFSNFAMWNFNGNVLEARIPWQALGFADPASQLNYKLTGQGKGLVVDTMSYEGIEISALLLNGRGRIKELFLLIFDLLIGSGKQVPLQRLPAPSRTTTTPGITRATASATRMASSRSPACTLTCSRTRPT